MGSALEKHRETIRSLRDLAFNIEPVVLRDQGFRPAVAELAKQLGLEHAVQIEFDVDEAERLNEKGQVGLYQIVREALNQAVRRGPPTRISVQIRETADGGLETIVADNGKGERRRATLVGIEERRGDAERPLLGPAGRGRRHRHPRRPPAVRGRARALESRVE